MAGMVEKLAEKDAKKTFAQLKPVCVDVLRSLSVENLGRLAEALRHQHHLTSPLVEYVLFPLRLGVRRLGGSDKVLLEALLSSLSLLLSRASSRDLLLSWDVFQELFVFLCMLLDGRMSEEAGFGVPTEDRTLRALQALQALLLSATESSLLQLYRNLPAIGHCVSVVVASLQAWESREVRRASLTALLALTGLSEGDIASFTGDGDCGQDTVDSLRALQERLGRGGGGDGGREGGGGERGRDETAQYRGEVLASFLPGVTVAVSKLLTTSTNLGQGIRNLCLMVWARFVGLVMDDRVLCKEDVDETEVLRAVGLEGKGNIELSNGSKTPSNPPKVHTVAESPSHPHNDHTLRVERSRQWRVETDRRLSVLAHKVVAVLVTSDGWRGRRGVVLWAHCLLGNCHRSLVTVAPILLEALLALSHDDYQQVSSSALLSLELFSAQHAQEVGGELAAVLEERLYALASSLPRLMRQHDDVRKVSTLQLLAGYLQLLGPHTVTLTHSHAHLSHITQALVQTLELDVCDSRVLEEMPQLTPQDKIYGPSLQQGPLAPSNPRGAEGSSEDRWWTLSLRYRHFRLPKIESLLQHCCQLLGFLGSLPSLLDHLVDMFRSSAQHRSELLVIIGHALLGAGGRGCVHGKEKPPHGVSGEEMCALVEGVLEEVTGDGWRGGGGEGGGALASPAVLQQCLQLQVVSVCARLLRASFLPHLQNQAYHLLARAGSPQPEVASLAVATLSTVASCTGGSSLAQLISANADYLVNCVALTLRTHKQEALQVLQAVMKHGAAEVLPLMRDSLDELLLCLDLRLLDNEGVWSVLRGLTAALYRWSLSEASEDGAGSEARTGSETGTGSESQGGWLEEETGEVGSEDVRRFFLDYHYRKGEEAPDRQESSRGEGGGEGAEDAASQPSLSPADQAAVDVLQRCPHFLPSPTPSSLSPSPSPSPSTPPPIPLCVLDCLSHCLHALRHNQRALLPEVHKVWPSFVPRLSDRSPPVALRAVEVLWDMCEVCGDFVRKRIVKGVWPVIAQSLTNLAAGSKGSDRLYQYTVTCRLQQKMLETVGVLPGKLQVSAVDLETLVHACLPYLSHNQPNLLLETCETSLTALVQFDPDIMWLLLHQLVPMEMTPPLHPSLLPYEFARLVDGEEFREAALPLLQLARE